MIPLLISKEISRVPISEAGDAMEYCYFGPRLRVCRSSVGFAMLVYGNIFAMFFWR